MTFDPDRPYVLVGGRHPLTYIQDGYGYDCKGNYLGRFDHNGEPNKDHPEPKEPVPEPKRRGRPPKVKAE